MKKILSCLLTVCFLLNLSCNNIFAAEKPRDEILGLIRQHFSTDYILISNSQGNTSITDGYVQVKVSIEGYVTYTSSGSYQNSTFDIAAVHNDGEGYISRSSSSITSTSVNTTTKKITVNYKVVTYIYKKNDSNYTNLIDTVTTTRSVTFSL